MSEDFVGSGWAFPLRTDKTGSIALVARERELEEAIRLILGTAPGERPMRPEFGCGIHDFVFAPADAGDGRAHRLRGAGRARPLGAADRGRRRRSSRSTPRTAACCYIDVHYSLAATQRPAQPRLPVLRDPGRMTTRSTEEPMSALPVPDLDDRRFQDLVDDAKRLVQQRCPEWTDHNVSRSRRHAHRDVRLDDRPAALPAQPRARTGCT